MTTYLYKIRHAKTGKYYSSKRWPASSAWNSEGRHYTKRALAQVLSSMYEPVIIEKWIAYKESEHIG
jgi:hypothetical protein